MTNCAGDATLTITKDKSASYQYLIKEGNLKGSYYSVSVGNSSVATATTEKISDGYVVKITGKSAGTTTVRINYHDQDYYFDKTVTVKVQ